LRARLLERVGLARVVLLGLDARSRLEKALEASLLEPRPPAEAWARLDLGGARRVAGHLLEVAHEGALLA
jgi:hypothetical protein